MKYLTFCLCLISQLCFTQIDTWNKKVVSSKKIKTATLHYDLSNVKRDHSNFPYGSIIEKTDFRPDGQVSKYTCFGCSFAIHSNEPNKDRIIKYYYEKEQLIKVVDYRLLGTFEPHFW